MPEARYIEGIGRRKTLIARVRITPATKASVSINNKDIATYFPMKEWQYSALSPITTAAIPQKFKITVKLNGGGISSQADAMRHGVARALVEYDPQLRKLLKSSGYLKRDPRAKERRKFGLKKARRAPQWSKR